MNRKIVNTITISVTGVILAGIGIASCADGGTPSLYDVAAQCATDAGAAEGAVPVDETPDGIKVRSGAADGIVGCIADTVGAPDADWDAATYDTRADFEGTYDWDGTDIRVTVSQGGEVYFTR